MPGHSDPEDLALSALGGEAGLMTAPGSDAHLADCPRCQSELDQLRAVVAAVRRVGPEDQPAAPPPAVWDAILGELGILGVSDGAAPGDELADRRARRGRRRPLLAVAVAAAAGLVAGVVAGAWGAVLVRDEGDDSPAVVASARLEPIVGTVGGGTVTVRGDAGSRVLVLMVEGLAPGPGLHEVWLLSDDGRRLVSLGLLDGSDARLAVPAEVDLRQFSVVDVSVERADGNPAHSGDSVLRGRLSG